jgi:2'-5' RNA ligase superfamily
VDSHREALRSFFASHEPFELVLGRLEQWDEGGAVYAAPSPEEPLRGMMRALWRLFPQFPPYRQDGLDPPPHSSLTETGGDDRDATRRRVEERLEGMLPARIPIGEVALMEEVEPDRWRVRQTFRLGA